MLKIDRENVVVDLFTGALDMTLTGPRPPNLPLRTAYSPAAPLTTEFSVLPSPLLSRSQ